MLSYTLILISLQVDASSTLLKHLNATSLALVRFHELACGDSQQRHCSTATPSYSSVIPGAHHPAHDPRPESDAMPSDLGSFPDTVANEVISLTVDTASRHEIHGLNLSLEPNCCGGWINCQDS